MFRTKLYYIGFISVICCIELVGGAFLRCYKGSLNDYEVTPLNGPLPDSFMACLDNSLPILIYTFGYRGRVAGPATTAVLTANVQKKKRNVLLLDWEEEAKSGVFGIPLGYAFSAVPNAKRVGKEMGAMLMRLQAAGVNLTNIHLMGHSLGAHIMGFAGRKVRLHGYSVERITGLDPAKAFFEGTLSMNIGLDRTCAKFVDIIHTDAGGYGTSTATGTVDIWPNYGATQPGCPVGDFEMFTPDDLCSHDRSWRYYVEAISSPTAFPAGAAPDHETWAVNGGLTKLTVYLGDLTNTRAQGNFYLTTNANSPFGRGSEGLKPDNTTRPQRDTTLTRLLTYFR